MKISDRKAHETVRMYEKRLAKENRTNRRRISKFRKRERIKQALADG